MKNCIFRKNSKGIAMITIMITITFLAIISTTLLYISATNYAMKSANALGKNNFYNTDAELVQLSVAIRQKVMRGGSAPTSAIGDFAGATAGTYSITKIVKEVYPSASGSDTLCEIVPDSTKPQDKYIFKTTNNSVVESAHPTVANTKRYTFKDIEVVHTSTNGYKNSVKSDFVLDVFEAVQPSNGGGGGVGSMSMLLDAPLSTDYSNFKNLTMAGNSFVADYNGTASWSDGHTYVCPGTNGLTMGPYDADGNVIEARINLFGDYNVIYGDLNLAGNSTLAVYGNLTVFGDIKISDHASLIVGDGAKVFQYTAGPLPGRTAVSSASIDANHVYPYPLTIQPVTAQDYTDFCTLLNLKDPSGSNYGLIKKIFKESPKDKNDSVPSGLSGKCLMDLQPTEVKCNAVTGLSNATFDLGRGYKTTDSSTIYGFEKFGIGFLPYNITTSSMNKDDYAYRLMLSFNNTPIVLQESTPFTTWIAKSPVTCKQAHCVVLSKLGTAQFNYITAGKGDNESKCYDNDLNPFNKVDIEFTGAANFKGKFGAFFNSDCNTSIDTMFGIAGGSGSGGGGTPVYASSASFSNYDRDFE